MSAGWLVGSSFGQLVGCYSVVGRVIPAGSYTVIYAPIGAFVLFLFYIFTIQEREMALKKDSQDGRGQVVKEAGVPRAPATAATSKTNSSPASSAKKE